MSTPTIIESILKRGAEGGLQSLMPRERKIWLIAEAEVLCDMEGIDSFLERYGESLTEAAEAFQEVGATQIAECLRAIHDLWPAREEDLLERTSSLITARTNYDFGDVLRLASHECKR